MWVGVCACGDCCTQMCTHVCTHVQMCTHVCTCVLMCVCGVNHGAGADVRGWVGAVRLTVGGCVFECWWLWLAGLSWVRVNGAGKMRPPRYVRMCVHVGTRLLVWAHVYLHTNVCVCSVGCWCDVRVLGWLMRLVGSCACDRLGPGAMCVCSDGPCARLGPVRVLGWVL